MTTKPLTGRVWFGFVLAGAVLVLLVPLLVVAVFVLKLLNLAAGE